jgi:hypothetical protein
VLAQGIAARGSDADEIASFVTRVQADAAQRLQVGDRGGAVAALSDGATQLVRGGGGAYERLGADGAAVRAEAGALLVDVNELARAHAEARGSVGAAVDLLTSARALALEGGEEFAAVRTAIDSSLERVGAAHKQITSRDDLVGHASVSGERTARITAGTPSMREWNGNGGYPRVTRPQLQVRGREDAIAFLDEGIGFQTAKQVMSAMNLGRGLRRGSPADAPAASLRLMFGDPTGAAEGLETLAASARLLSGTKELGVGAKTAAEVIARVDARFATLTPPEGAVVAIEA